MQKGSILLKQSEHLMKFFSKYFTLSTFARSTAKWSFIVEKEKKQFQIINSKNLSYCLSWIKAGE